MKRLITLTFLTLIPSLLVLALFGCEGKKEETALYTGPTETPSSTSLKIPFKDPIEPALYELPSGALATWRDYAKYRPTLVLFSTHPLLTPTPKERKKTVEDLLKHGAAAEIVSRARALSSDPAILPPEAVSAALNVSLFSELVIVLPNQKTPDEVNLDDLRKKMLSAGFLTETEASELTLNNGVVNGKVRGIPILIVHPERLPKITTPVILHVDLGYFKDMYTNEIKTPAYDLLYQLVTDLKAAAYPTLAVTLSFSNQEVGFALESRFLNRDLAEIMRKPQLLDGNTPISWTLRAQAMYASAMFGETKARELTEQAVKTTPDDAAAHYARALDLFKQNLPDEGFTALDHAVTLDRGYGLEYLTLAERGKDMGETDKSIELLQKAAQAIPDNPFIRRELAHQLIQSGRAKEARPFIDELQKLDWSETFYPEIPPLLARMAEAASVDVVLPKVHAQKTAPASKPAAMPGFNHKGMGFPHRP